MRMAPVWLIAIVAAGGCDAPEGPRRADSRYLSQKIPAIKIAVDDKDSSVVPQLVHDLDSDDPAVRFYAIEGLQRLTGQTFDYLYYQDRETRRPAVMKWRQWLNDQKKGEVAERTARPTTR